MNKYSIGEEVEFYLDGLRYGKGVVKAIYNHTVEVELTVPCKEFDPGTMILVSTNEIIEPDFFPIGTTVNVTRKADDLFSHDFTGIVVGRHGEYFTIRDQADDNWDVEYHQLKHNSEID